MNLRAGYLDCRINAAANLFPRYLFHDYRIIVHHPPVAMHKSTLNNPSASCISNGYVNNEITYNLYAPFDIE